MGPDDDELMDAAGSTTEFGGDSNNQQAGQPMGESLAQEAMAGNVKRSASKRGPVQLDGPSGPNMLEKRAGNVQKSPKVRNSKSRSAFFGDFWGSPKGIKVRRICPESPEPQRLMLFSRQIPLTHGMIHVVQSQLTQPK